MKKWQIALTAIFGFMLVAFAAGFVLCTYVF
jgi:hypothetical protein